LKKGDRILLTEMEHHSNLVPWYILAAEKGIQIDFIHVGEQGFLDQDRFQELRKEVRAWWRSRYVERAGVINPVQEMTQRALQAGACVLSMEHIGPAFSSVG
jgi:cysteine desulfurase/selenocysteine lyase